MALGYSSFSEAPFASSIQIGVLPNVFVYPDGVFGTGAVGDPLLVSGILISGVSAQGLIGNIAATLQPTIVGVQGTGQIGYANTTTSDQVVAVGVQGVGEIGAVIVKIDDSIVPLYFP